MADKISISPVKVLKIRSNSFDFNPKVFIYLSSIYSDKTEKGWACIEPDNEGAKWIVQLALTAKLHNLDTYVLGEYFEDTFSDGVTKEKRIKILEFGLE